jgi:rhamnose transport system permease protein
MLATAIAPLFTSRQGKTYLGIRGWNVALGLLIIIVCSWGALSSPKFLSLTQLLAAGNAEVVTGLLALGLALVVMAGEIDISVTSNLALCTTVAGMLARAHVPVGLVLVVPLLVGTALGLLNGILVGLAGAPSLAVTLGTMGAYQGLAYLIGGSGGFTDYPSLVENIGAGYLGPIPVPLMVFSVVAAVFSVLLVTTRQGRFLYTVGRAPEVARHSGISVVVVKAVAFALSGLTAGIAGLVFIGYYGSGGGDSASGTILLVVTAVCLGGLDIYGGSGRFSGLVLGLVLMAVLQSVMGLLNISTTAQTIVIGVLLLSSVGFSRVLGGGRLMTHLSRLLPNARS